MGTEVWLRNPANYIREVVEVGHLNIAWDYGFIKKRRIDPERFSALYIPSPFDYRMLLVGIQGSAEFTRENGLNDPVAVYPTWSYEEDDWELLERLVTRPISLDEDLCNDPHLPPRLRPRFGQPHRVVVTDLPDARSAHGKKFLKELAFLQEEFPKCTIHLHGSYSFRAMFALGFGAADYDPRASASRGSITLPNGRNTEWEDAARLKQWVHVIGFSFGDLSEPRERCIFNIKSALWASEHWGENENFFTRKPQQKKEPELPPSAEVMTMSTLTFKGPQTQSHLTTKRKPKENDQLICSHCSLWDVCKYYREGAVCSVPKTPGSKLAELFRSRDSEKIIDALGSVVSKQADRVERGLMDEEAEDRLSPEVTKMMNSLFRNGVQLAKLVNPELNGKGQSVMVNVGQGHVEGVFSPQQLTSKIIAQLEAQGIRRGDITMDMVKEYLQEQMEDPEDAVNQPREIAASIVEDDEE